MEIQYITVQQVCEILQLSDETVIRLCKKGELKYRKFGGKYRIDPKSLDVDYGKKKLKLF